MQANDLAILPGKSGAKSGASSTSLCGGLRRFQVVHDKVAREARHDDGPLSVCAGCTHRSTLTAAGGTLIAGGVVRSLRVVRGLCMKWLLDRFKSPRQKAADCFAKGKLALDANDFDLAISWFNACIQHDPSHATGFYGRGFANLKKADYDRAIADLSEAIRLGPDNAYSYYYRSLCYSGKGRGTLEGIDLEKAMRLGAQIDAAQDAATGSPAAPIESSAEVVMALRAALREVSLHDLNDTVRALAGRAMTQLDSRAPSQLPALLDALRNDEPAIRFSAAHSLGDLGPAARPALGPLTQTLQDRDLGVRVQAARAVWQIDRQADAALPVLMEAVQSDDEVLRWIAADCLGEIGPKAAAAVPALREALKRPAEIEHVRTGIALALERIGNAP